jgi:hypothetical protein
VSETVFIFGAGASQQAGAPVMQDFLDVARQLKKEKQNEEIASDSDLVFKGIDALQRVHSKAQLDIHNLESVFAAFEMARMLNRLPGLSEEEVNQLPSAMGRVIQHTLEAKILLPVSDRRVLSPEPYHSFVNAIKKYLKGGRVSFITFNYDLCLDFALHSNSYVPQYHLGSFDQQEAPNGVNVFKLHGSLNWARCQSCKDVVAWELREYLKNRRWESVAFGGEDSVRLAMAKDLLRFSHCPDSPGAKEPVVVPPTWNKAEHHAELRSVWLNAARQLSDAENIFVCGYSLPETDKFFHYLYALGSIGEASLKRFWVFNPDEAVAGRFSKILGSAAQSRFKFERRLFKDAVPIIAQNID